MQAMVGLSTYAAVYKDAERAQVPVCMHIRAQPTAADADPQSPKLQIAFDTTWSLRDSCGTSLEPHDVDWILNPNQKRRINFKHTSTFSERALRVSRSRCR